jgi:hypothetical protein
VAGSTFTDASGNGNSAASQFNWTFDSTGPTMTITAAEGSDGFTSNDATLALTFTSNEATTNFAVGDITVSNGHESFQCLTYMQRYYRHIYTTTDGASSPIDVAGLTFTEHSG